MIERRRLSPEEIPQYRVKRKPAKRKPPSPPNRKHFTEENVLRLRSKRKQDLIWDEAGRSREDFARGLAILVSPRGAKSYRCVYYYPGSSKPHWIHLGRVGELRLSEARKRCRDSRGRAREGEDPTANDAAKSDAFKSAVESYIAHEQIGRHKNKSAKETQQVMLKNCAEWERRPVATLRYSEIDALLEGIRDGDDDKKPRPYLANRLYAHLHDFFDWCVRKQMVPVSPMASMEKPWRGATRRTRNWFKGDAGLNAIKSLWRAADELGGNEGKYLKMLLLTGKRRGALAAMRWEEIDADWFWNAPPGSKTKRLHAVPLARRAQRVLHPRAKSGLVFGKLALNDLAKKIAERSGLDDFFLHGVRHLVETQSAGLLAPHIRDLLFDHATPRGAGAGYDHHDYRAEMTAAVETWARHVEAQVAPEGVTRLR
jgi:integrase